MLINTIGTILSYAAGTYAMCKTLSFEVSDDARIHLKIKWVKFLIIAFIATVLITTLQYLLGTVLPIDIA